MAVRTCVRCGEGRPEDRYHFQMTPRGYLARTCRECYRAIARARWAANRAAERLNAAPVGPPTDRRCRKCGETKPLTAEFFGRDRNSSCGFGYRCKECRREESRRRYLADPQSVRERVRMHYRLQREAEGYEVKPNPNANGAYRKPAGRAPAFPSEPLSVWADVVLEQDHRDHDEIAGAMGVDDRKLRQVTGREYRTVTVGVADGMLTRYGRSVLVPPDRAEPWRAQLEARWREAPGNGSRILGYLDAAEVLAERGVIVERVEDLWEELRDE